MREYIVETMQVEKSYGSLLALNDVSIHVKRGEIYGLIGDNGAGKTTLLKALVGHIWPTKGSVCLFQQQGERNLERCRKQIGAMIEGAAFFPNMSVEKNMEYCRLLKGVPGKERTEQILQLVGLWERRKSKCKKLSMGMKQRLGLAIAMIGEPQLLILDEPINGLDPSGIIEFRHILHRLNKEKNITILLSSHLLSELQQTATTFGFLHKGKLIEEISANDLREKCADHLEIAVSDVESYTAMLDQKFPDDIYKVLPNHVIQLSGPRHEVEYYSRLAAEQGILITGLSRRQISLEDYYMDLKGDAGHA